MIPFSGVRFTPTRLRWTSTKSNQQVNAMQETLFSQCLFVDVEEECQLNTMKKSGIIEDASVCVHVPKTGESFLPWTQWLLMCRVPTNRSQSWTWCQEYLLLSFMSVNVEKLFFFPEQCQVLYKYCISAETGKWKNLDMDTVYCWSGKGYTKNPCAAARTTEMDLGHPWKKRTVGKSPVTLMNAVLWVLGNILWWDAVCAPAHKVVGTAKVMTWRCGS